MASSIGGYRSPVNLGLNKLPTTSDPELFEELTPVFNSIHLINAYLDRLRTIAGGGGSGQSPSDTLPFNRFFVSTALQVIEIGDLVCPASNGSNGIVKGALADNYGSGAPYCHFSGIALTRGDIGDDIRVGVGPAVLEVPGASGGSPVWGFGSRATNGNWSTYGGLYLGNPGASSVPAGGTVYPMPVAMGISAGYALFGQFLLR